MNTENQEIIFRRKFVIAYFEANMYSYSSDYIFLKDKNTYKPFFFESLPDAEVGFRELVKKPEFKILLQTGFITEIYFPEVSTNE